MYGPTTTVKRVNQHYRTLLLLRHAKSGYPADVADHDRPLAPRGVRESGLAGEWLRTHAPTIDAVLCSTATRTRATLERIRVDAPVHYTEQLYGAPPGGVIDEINRAQSHFDTAVDTLLVIGHEPAMSAVALGLADDDDSNATATEQISTKFPTSAFAVLHTTQPWERLELSGAALVGFHVPR